MLMILRDWDFSACCKEYPCRNYCISALATGGPIDARKMGIIVIRFEKESLKEEREVSIFLQTRD